ncbi:MAG: glutamate-1-semialdehyde 2,1-aminomutase [Methylotenera sp.]|nr:glutamate-1-semialdehyde 2,1-aminomutase [Oligoflexia bacterium]
MIELNTKKSEAFMERARKVAPGGVHSPVRGFRGVGGTPRFIASAKGAQLTDVDGNSYIDYCMSWGPLLFGHQDPEIAEVVREALTRGWSYGAAEPLSLELAEFMTHEIACLEKVRFVNSGTEAVMSALRVARAATGRPKILKFEGCYHGHVDSMLVKAGSGLAEMASPDSAGVSASVAAETIVVPLNDPQALEAAFELHGKEIAAIIVEPIPANNGLLLQNADFLPSLFRVAKKYGSLVIFDEVITGFRVALGGMAERTGLTPDLVTYGKIIGGGFPVGAYGGRAELMDQVAPAGPVYQAGTLSANPIAMSAGLAMLKKIKRENPYPVLESRTRELAASLEKALPGVQIQTDASLFWPIFAPLSSKKKVRTPADFPEGQKEQYSKLFHFLLSKGIYLPPSGYEVSFLSTAHDTASIQALVRGFEEFHQAHPLQKAP